MHATPPESDRPAQRAEQAERESSVERVSSKAVPAAGARHRGPRGAAWRRGCLGWASLLLLALCIRGGVLVASSANLSADVDGYRWLAESLATHHVYGAVDAQGVAHPTAFRPPLYPLLLSTCVVDGQLNLSAVRGLHLLLGLLSVAGTYVLGQRMLGARAGWLAGLLVAIDPILLVQSTYVMTETLAVTVCVGCWLLWLALLRCYEHAAQRPRRWALLSLSLAIALTAAFFCRPTFLIWAVFLCGWLALMGIRDRQSGPLATAFVIAIVLVVSISGWAYRNDQQLGHPVWATSHGGYTLLLGNNPPFYDYLREGTFGVAWDAEPFHRAWTQRYASDPMSETFWRQHADSDGAAPMVDDEIADDRLAYLVARQTIHQQPSMFAWACVVRAARLWSPLPHRTEHRAGPKLWGIAAFYAAWFVVAAVGVWRLGGSCGGPLGWPGCCWRSP